MFCYTLTFLFLPHLFFWFTIKATVDRVFKDCTFFTLTTRRRQVTYLNLLLYHDQNYGLIYILEILNQKGNYAALKKCAAISPSTSVYLCSVDTADHTEEGCACQRLGDRLSNYVLHSYHCSGIGSSSRGGGYSNCVHLKTN